MCDADLGEDDTLDDHVGEHVGDLYLNNGGEWACFDCAAQLRHELHAVQDEEYGRCTCRHCQHVRGQS